MGLFGFFRRFKPYDQIAMLVDAVADRINDKYELQGEFKLVEGGATFKARIVDIKPSTTIRMPDKED